GSLSSQIKHSPGNPGRFIPKKTCLAQYTQHELDLVAAQLNNRPRKTLKFKTPKEIIERGVALTD
ncbi:hypothetical protein FSF34_023145, partial [Escherichia coli]|nr:hypothetical protein [Escherichia coli]MBB9967330.1 hypothetical protein [Escherichia coli]MCL3991492.1 hypothetical protein [Escherichia coli]NPH19762.1 hypothetical protein [Escherichia coli]